MQSVNLRAGSLVVSIQTDEADLQTAVQCAHNEMQWLQESWTSAGSEAVRVRGSEDFDFGGR